MSNPRTKRGHRPLAVGETIAAGDLIWFASRWQPVEEFKDAIGTTVHPLSYRYCRKLVKGGAS